MPRSLYSYLNIFFRFFHKGWWIVILLAMLLNLISTESGQLSATMINIAATFLLLKVATVIHEYGHLAAARLVGGRPRRMILGIGHEIFRTEVASVKIVLNSIPIGGLAWATFDDQPFLKWRYAAYISGGVGLNLLVASLFYFLFGMNESYFSGEHGVDLASPMIFANSLGIINLIPFYTSFYGPKMPTDGLTLLQLVFNKDKFKNLACKIEFFEAYENIENREYDKAYAILSNYHQKFPEDPLPVLAMSGVHIKRMQVDEALQMLSSLEKRINEKELKKHSGQIYNNLAWIYLLKEDIDLAYHYASLALKAAPKANFAWGTYGAVLIEKGSIQTGMKWLFKNMDLEHPNTTTLSASTYLMVAYHQRDDKKSRDMHLKFVQKNIKKLDQDDHIIFERNLQKVGINDSRMETNNGKEIQALE